MLRIKVGTLDIYGCREALERLDDYVDRELSPEEERRVRQHLKICRQCAQKFKFQQDLLVGMRAKVGQLPPSADVDALKDKINALLEAVE